MILLVEAFQHKFELEKIYVYTPKPSPSKASQITIANGYFSKISFFEKKLN